MKTTYSLFIALLFFFCSCVRPESKEELVVISDPSIRTAGDITEYLEAATRTGAVKVRINGHIWSWHTPFHSPLVVDLEAQPSNTLIVTDETEDEEIKEWLIHNKTNWITFTPSEHSSRQLYWTVIDAMESLKIYYSASRAVSKSDNRCLLEAIEPTSRGR